jgi:tetratricopeptide (TPR) repeat protein
MAERKTCFVVMPIRKDGTSEHAHFKSLYNVVLKPTLSAAGYEVIRGDEVQDNGAITKNIVTQLAEADLVVADLTDLNPNVFYELGVRHVFRSSGTIVIVDELRTDSVPFDLTAYRVLSYRGDFAGLDDLRRELVAFVRQWETLGLDHVDNPVHDWIPALPSNAVLAVQTPEGELRQRLAQVERKLRDYEKKYGLMPAGSDGGIDSPLSAVLHVLQSAEQGSLPQELLERATDAVLKGQRLQFLTAIRKILEHRTRYSVRQMLTLIAGADALGLDEVTNALYNYARDLYPTDRELRESELGRFAHSDDPADRERARQELLRDLNITLDDEGVHFPNKFDDNAILLLGISVDAYHRDNLHEQALTITRAMAEHFPSSTVAVRNYARALGYVGRSDECLEWHRKSIWCPDVSDTSAVWLGNELHNRERFADAVEAYLCACILDPEDGANFSYVSNSLSYALRELLKVPFRKPARLLPDGVSSEYVRQTLIAAYSCMALTGRDRERCSEAALRENIDLRELLTQLDDEDSPLRMSENDRQRFALQLYDMFRTDLTDPLHTMSESLHRASKETKKLYLEDIDGGTGSI